MVDADVPVLACPTNIAAGAAQQVGVPIDKPALALGDFVVI
jgi:hypothetical protein